MHLDDEVARTLDRIGVSEGFLARSRPGSGLRLGRIGDVPQLNLSSVTSRGQQSAVHTERYRIEIAGASD